MQEHFQGCRKNSYTARWDLSCVSPLAKKYRKSSYTFQQRRATHINRSYWAVQEFSYSPESAPACGPPFSNSLGSLPTLMLRGVMQYSSQRSQSFYSTSRSCLQLLLFKSVGRLHSAEKCRKASYTFQQRKAAHEGSRWVVQEFFLQHWRYSCIWASSQQQCRKSSYTIVGRLSTLLLRGGPRHKKASLSTALRDIVAPPVKKCRKTPLCRKVWEDFLHFSADKSCT